MWIREKEKMTKTKKKKKKRMKCLSPLDHHHHHHYPSQRVKCCFVHKHTLDFVSPRRLLLLLFCLYGRTPLEYVVRVNGSSSRALPRLTVWVCVSVTIVDRCACVWSLFLFNSNNNKKKM